MPKDKCHFQYQPAGGRALWREAHAHKGGYATPYCVRWELSLFGFCLPFAKTKCAKLAIANPPYEGGEKEIVRWLLLWLPAKKCVGKKF